MSDYPRFECKPNDIAFTKVALPYGWMQNMAPLPVVYEGLIFRTTEHLFQALRFDENSKHFTIIREIVSPMEAKTYARNHENDMVIPMKGEKDVGNMLTCLILKIRHNHHKIIQPLIDTGDAHLIEDVTNRPEGSGRFWGATRDGHEWVGNNILGELWMKVRKSNQFTF